MRTRKRVYVSPSRDPTSEEKVQLDATTSAKDREVTKKRNVLVVPIAGTKKAHVQVTPNRKPCHDHKASRDLRRKDLKDKMDPPAADESAIPEHAEEYRVSVQEPKVANSKDLLALPSEGTKKNAVPVNKGADYDVEVGEQSQERRRREKSKPLPDEQLGGSDMKLDKGSKLLVCAEAIRLDTGTSSEKNTKKTNDTELMPPPTKIPRCNSPGPRIPSKSPSIMGKILGHMDKDQPKKKEKKEDVAMRHPYWYPVPLEPLMTEKRVEDEQTPKELESTATSVQKEPQLTKEEGPELPEAERQLIANKLLTCVPQRVLFLFALKNSFSMPPPPSRAGPSEKLLAKGAPGDVTPMADVAVGDTQVRFSGDEAVRVNLPDLSQITCPFWPACLCGDECPLIHPPMVYRTDENLTAPVTPLTTVPMVPPPREMNLVPVEERRCRQRERTEHEGKRDRSRVPFSGRRNYPDERNRSSDRQSRQHQHRKQRAKTCFDVIAEFPRAPSAHLEAVNINRKIISNTDQGAQQPMLNPIRASSFTSENREVSSSTASPDCSKYLDPEDIVAAIDTAIAEGPVDIPAPRKPAKAEAPCLFRTQCMDRKCLKKHPDNCEFGTHCDLSTCLLRHPAGKKPVAAAFPMANKKDM